MRPAVSIDIIRQQTLLMEVLVFEELKENLKVEKNNKIIYLNSFPSKFVNHSIRYFNDDNFFKKPFT
jgi:hypothetical protein